MQRMSEVQTVPVQEPLQSLTWSQGKGFSEALKHGVGPLATQHCGAPKSRKSEVENFTTVFQQATTVQSPSKLLNV